jgi:magnesium-transporting ATPase (P-type)
MSSGKQKNSQQRSTTFTIRSIFVITTVFAAAAVSLGYLFRAANGASEEIGPFVVVTMMMPLALMVVMSWTFRITKWYSKRKRR